MYKLKPRYEAFQVVDGPFAGHTYRPGEVYETVPPREKQKFDVVKSENRKIEKNVKPEKS